jgi:hypothetical protein
MTNTYTMPSVDDYRSADRAGKSNMRSAATGAMMACIDALDIDGASVIRSRMTEWTESNTRSTVDIDWNAIASVRVATLRAAADAIVNGTIVPNGTPDGFVLTFDSSATADDDAVARIASESITRSTKRPLRSVITDTVVPMMTVGEFYTVADVAHMIEKSVDIYATGVSHGAVRNALESNKVPNVRFVPATATTVNGCRRES